MKDAYYFSHDSNAKDDPKCVMLIEQLGPEGYGIFWILIETLRDQPDYKYPLVLIPAIARRYNTTAEKIKAVVFKYHLFVTTDNEFFFSDSLIRRMKPLEDKRLQAQKAGFASAEKRKSLPQIPTDVQPTFNVSSTSVQPVKESKVEYSTTDESIEEKRIKLTPAANAASKFVKPSIEDVTNYLSNEKNIDFFTAQGIADGFWHFYESKGWKVGKNPMQVWKSAVSGWLNRKSNHESKNGLKNDSKKSLWDHHVEVNKKVNELIHQECNS